MKRLLLAFAIMLSSYSYSQTTNEEYNYCVKGYATTIKEGLDIKKGYKVENVETSYRGDRTTEFKALIDIAKKKPIAYIMIFTNKGYPASYYCIPSNGSNGEIMTKAYQDMMAGVDASFSGKDMLKAWVWALMNLTSKSIK
jgi:hypothetical protein